MSNVSCNSSIFWASKHEFKIFTCSCIDWVMFILESFNEFNFELTNNELHTNMSDDHVVCVVVIFKSNIRTHNIKFISDWCCDLFINQIWYTFSLTIQKNSSEHLECINDLSTFIFSLEIKLIVNSLFSNRIFFEQNIKNRINDSS